MTREQTVIFFLRKMNMNFLTVLQIWGLCPVFLNLGRLVVVLTKNTAEKTPGFLRLVPGDDPGFSWLPECSGWTLGHRQGALGPGVCRTTRKPESHGRSQHLVYSPSRDARATRSAISATSQGTEAGWQTLAEARKPAEAAGVPSRDLRSDSGLRNRESLH